MTAGLTSLLFVKSFFKIDLIDLETLQNKLLVNGTPTMKRQPYTKYILYTKLMLWKSYFILLNLKKKLEPGSGLYRHETPLI